MVHRSGANGELVLKPTNGPEETASALLQTLAAKHCLPPISAVINSPVMIQTGDELIIMPQGYHRECGGLFVTNGEAPPEVNFDQAVESLRLIFEEFDFQTEEYGWYDDRSQIATTPPCLSLEGGGITTRYCY